MSIQSELLVAAFDLGSFLSGRPIRITKEKLSQAEKILKEANSLVEQFFNDSLTLRPLSSELKKEDYKGFVDVLRNNAVAKELIERFARIQGPSSEITEDIVVSLTNIIMRLNEQIPVNQSETLFGIDDLDPSDYEKFKFMQIIRTIDDPTYILQLMIHGQLTDTEVEAMKVFYPNLLDFYKRLILQKLALHIGKGKDSLSLGRHKQHQLGVILEINRLTPEQIESLQATYQQEKGGGDYAGSGMSDLSEVNTIQYRQ